MKKLIDLGTDCLKILNLGNEFAIKLSTKY